MILCNIIGRKLCPDRQSIGVTGENKAETIRFAAGLDVGGVSIADASCWVCLQNRLGEVDRAQLTPIKDGEALHFDWELTRTATQEGGRLCVYLEFQKAGDILLRTYQTAFYLDGSFDVDTPMERQYPTVLQDMEARVSHVEQVGGQIDAAAIKAEANALSALDSATQAAASAGVATEQAGKATTGAGTAVEQAQAATQASSTASGKATQAAQSAAQASGSASTATTQADRAAQLVSQAESLLSQQPRQFLVAAIADRDALTGLRQCDRCDVVETQSTYIYDTQNIDGDDVNPEWILVSRWDAMNSVSWDVVEGKPAFAKVATTGSYGDLSNIPEKFQAPIALNGTGNSVVWDFALGDSAVVTLSGDKPIVLQNVPAGAFGTIQVYGGLLQIPEGERNPLYNMLTPLDTEHMTYSFYYNGVSFDWNNLPYKGAAL